MFATRLVPLLVLALTCHAQHGREQEQPSESSSFKTWPDSSADFPDCPFEKSSTFADFQYDDSQNTVPHGTGADTWYPSWSKSGDLFTTFTDGTVNGVSSSSCGPCQTPPNNGSFITQGFARAIGQTPSTLNVTDASVFKGSSALPYQGRYPSGSLYYKGVYYSGTYALAELWGNEQFPCQNWCVQGPFVGFRHTTDNGQTWDEPRPQMALDFESYEASSNLFGEEGPICDGYINNTMPGPDDPCTKFMGKCSPYTCVGKWHGKVKFGAPHVVDLGQELEHAPPRADGSPDPRVYMVGHGANKQYQPHSWMHGSQVYMSRTKQEPSVEVMGRGEHWEYFAGYNSSSTQTQSSPQTALWTDDIERAAPLFTWENKTGAVTMSYAPKLGKFLMVVGTPTCGAVSCNGTGAMKSSFDFYVLESDAITGPFKIVTYLKAFGPQAYFVNIPTKFLEATDPELFGYQEGYLSYSANFADTKVPGGDPAGSGYHWNLLRMRLTLSSA